MSELRHIHRICDKKEVCTACTACVNSCPADAIKIERNENGFFEAFVDEDKCINCGLCNRLCHLNEKPLVNNNMPQFFAACSNDDEVLEECSSGGISYELGKYVILQNGVVYGAVYESLLCVKHMRAASLDELKLFRKSKYLESYLDLCFAKVKEDLDNNKIVLFTGVGCQIAGLYKYLQKSYSNLYTCEVVCHGMPSVLPLKKYIQETENKSNKKIQKIVFRDKSKGWKNNCIVEYYDDGTKEKIFSSKHQVHSLYLEGLNMRSGCSKCEYCKIPRIADITLGDFWKYTGKLSHNSHNNGISLVSINNEKGAGLLKNIMNNISFENVDKELALSSCRHINQPPALNFNHESFMKMLREKELSEINSYFKYIGDMVNYKELKIVTDINRENILQIFWNNQQDIIYYVNQNGKLLGIITFGRFMDNYNNQSEWINTDCAKVLYDENYIINIKKVFDISDKINRIPIIDSEGRLLFEIRRKNAPVICPYNWNKKYFDYAVKYEKVINNKELIVIDEVSQIRDINNMESKCLCVNTIGRKRIINEAFKLECFTIKEYQKKSDIEIKAIKALLTLNNMNVGTVYIKRPDLITGYPYSQFQNEMIQNELSFPKLSEGIIENENILKKLFKEKYSYEYVSSLRKVPSIIKKENRYVHLNNNSTNINVVSGIRKTTKQPQKYDCTIHIYGRCGAFGYAVEDNDTMPSKLQELLNKHGKNIRVLNHGLWGADDEYVINNFFFDVKEKVIIPGDLVVIYMDYIECIDKIKDMLAVIEDTSIPFHEFAEGKTLFYDRPGHMTAEGYEFIAGYIYDCLFNRKNAFKNDVQKSDFYYKIKYFFSENELPYHENEDEKLNAYFNKIDNLLPTETFANKRIGSIVMNCNPFTNGHKYLVEKASGEVDILLIFVLEENKSFFKFEDRIEMVRLGTQHLENVYVVPSGNFIISALTFPEYFLKEQNQSIKVNPVNDLELFGKSIAPHFNIRVRYVGTEPIDKVTNQYNALMKDVLPRYNIEVKEIERLKYNEKFISATEVRKCIKEKNYNGLVNLLPEKVLQYIKEN